MTEEKTKPSELPIRIKVPDFNHVPIEELKGFTPTEKFWIITASILVIITIAEFIYFLKN